MDQLTQGLVRSWTLFLLVILICSLGCKSRKAAGGEVLEKIKEGDQAVMVFPEYDGVYSRVILSSPGLPE